MIIVQCTKKLAGELNAPFLSEKPQQANPLYCWHAHIFTYNRRKCVLVMNNSTRYNFMMYGLVKSDFTHFGELLVKHISENMLADEIDQALVNRYLDNVGESSYAPTSDRSIVSQINEMVSVAQQIMEMNMAKTGDLGINKVNRFMNKYIFMKLPKLYSAETMRDELLSLS
ncbi:hypothetical protein PAECIP111893_03788 [Paenibacillus plantiphilus]|uniref:DUF6933 domain-containing protein n=1 Tax=Paenibacillus plantiphilus TaxID=2905650 RepID=A0ABN8GWZ0_9BACL|nr:hypothetical protein [Paenibacillus plantiphilus]CAH1214367.1 hypothetical protein PAECIP111893_03788 [Paenibacillus plantiphilus]